MSLHELPSSTIPQDAIIRSVLIDHHEAKTDYKMTRAIMYRLTGNGEIAAVKVGRRTFWYRASVEAFLRKQPTPQIRKAKK